MLLNLHDVQSLLRSPGSIAGELHLTWRETKLTAIEARTSDGAVRPLLVAAGQPVLVDFDNSVLSAAHYQSMNDNLSLIPRRWNGLRLLKATLLGGAKVSRLKFRRLHQLVGAGRCRPLVLMVGAAVAGVGTEILYAAEDIDLIAFDIYPTPLTTFIADAHDIPLKDESVDAVCIQAVLEHVLSPEQVVDEIRRVLKPGGLIYAETPFMQQVHEGPYDFTRFTESGHRWLFRGFSSIDRGALGGPGLSFYWATRYLMWGLFRNRALATLLAAPAALVALLDRLIPEARRIDGANGVYFLGRKETSEISPKEAIATYLGAQKD